MRLSLLTPSTLHTPFAITVSSLSEQVLLLEQGKWNLKIWPTNRPTDDRRTWGVIGSFLSNNKNVYVKGRDWWKIQFWWMNINRFVFRISKCIILMSHSKCNFSHSGLGIYNRKKKVRKQKPRTRPTKHTLVHEKKNSLKKTRSRPRKRPRKKKVFLFFQNSTKKAIKKTTKQERKQELDQENKKKNFLFSWSLFWSSSC